jgi:hypothetical protein
MLGSLTLLLLASVWGLRSPAGALCAGVSLAVFPLIQQHVPSLADLSYLGTGAAAIGLARNPAGAFGGPPLWRQLRPKGRSAGPDLSITAIAGEHPAAGHRGRDEVHA